jgi:uncharacterized protein YbcV (DUF1398 family)
MNTEAMRAALEGSEAGRLTFPEVVQMLLGAGVESYCADLMQGTDTFYVPNGETHVEKMKLARGKIAESFSQDGLIAAIRTVQKDEIRYPEFLRRIMAAGVAAYRVFLTGKRAVYIGRKGEIHIEEFPAART